MRWGQRIAGGAAPRLCAALALAVTVMASTTRAEAGPGLLTAIEGHVTLERAGRSSALPFDFSDTVVAGDQLHTGHGSLARISFWSDADLRWSQAAILLREHTHMRFEPYGDRGAVTVETGNLAVRASNVEIRTPNTITRAEPAFVDIAVEPDPQGAGADVTTICVLAG